MPDPNPFRRSLLPRPPGPGLGARLARALDTSVKALTVFALIALSTGYFRSAARPHGPCRFAATQATASQLRSGVSLFLAENPADEVPCPQPMSLVDKGILDGRSRLVDSWGQPFQIHCAAGQIAVISPGPDGRFGTADDID